MRTRDCSAQILLMADSSRPLLTSTLRRSCLYRSHVWCKREHGLQTWFFTLLTSSFSELSAPMSILLEILSKWPRYLSHGPAILMWSVVHLPLTLIRMCAPCNMPGRDELLSAL